MHRPHVHTSPARNNILAMSGLYGIFISPYCITQKLPMVSTFRNLPYLFYDIVSTIMSFTLFFIFYFPVSIYEMNGIQYLLTFTINGISAVVDFYIVSAT